MIARIALIPVFAASALTIFGQHGMRPNPGGAGSILYPGALPTGPGSVLYPATGRPPAIPGAITDTRFAGRLGRNLVGVPPSAFHQRHERSLIVPYPIYYGAFSYGYGYGYDPSAAYYPPESAAPAPPSVVINQTFVGTSPTTTSDSSPGLKLYEGIPPVVEPAPAPSADAVDSTKNSDEPTLYLIAFKDHTIIPALAYWLEGKTLNYISVEHSVNQASLDLIDRDLSQQLNDQRRVEFKLK